MITALTIINTLAIIFILFDMKSKYYFEFKRDLTFSKRTLVGYRLILWKKLSEYSASGVFVIKFPLKNKEKVETAEEIQRMLSYSPQNKIQSLNAKFSWLKTWQEVREFEKTYSVIDDKFVKKLVSSFIPKD